MGSALVLLIVLVFIFCFLFCSLFSELYKNKKLFKYLFKIQKPILIKEVFQLFIIIILLGILFLHIVVVGIYSKDIFSCKRPICGYGDCSRDLKIAMSSLNQALTYEKSLGSKISYNSVQEYANVFAKRLNLIDVKYLNTDKFPYSEYTKNDRIKGNLSDFVPNPIIIDSRGYLYTFKKFQNSCNVVNIDNVNSSDCVMVVDLNYLSMPNEYTRSQRKFKDRYFLIINGNNDTVILPKMYYWFIFPEKEVTNG